MKKTQRTTKKKPANDNARIINDAAIKFINDSKGASYPTYKELAELTGLHINTIQNHYKNLKFNPSESASKSFTPLVINNLYNLTRKSPSAAKLWLQFMEGWVEKTDATVLNNNINTNLEINEDNLDKYKSDIEELLAKIYR